MVETATATRSPVSWQTVWFILIAVASNSIMQSNLSAFAPPNLGYYMRASPFVCASAAFALLIRLTVYISKGNPLCWSAREALKHHFKVLDDTPRDAAFVLEKMNSIRFALFVFAALLPAVKLMGMSGLPWTQTSVGMFLGSYIIVEVVVLLASQAPESAHGPRENSPSQQTHPGEHLVNDLQSPLNVVDSLCFGVAAFANLSLLIYNYAMVFVTIFPLKVFNFPMETSAVLLVVISVFLAIPGPTRVLAIVSLAGSVGDITLEFLSCLPSSSFTRCLQYVPRIYIITCPLFFSIGLITYIFFATAAILSLKDNPHLLREKGLLYLIKRQFESLSARVYFAFLVTLAVPLLWYYICYDPAGTSRSSWINIG